MTPLEAAILCVDAYETEDVGSDDCHAIIDTDGNEVRVAFRGSEDGGDWLSNLRRVRVEFGAGTAHRGFVDSLLQISSRLTAEVKDMCGPDTLLHATGHSRGGAHAQLFAAQMRMQGHSLVRVTTFGSPRVFDDKAARWFDACIPHDRYVYENDIVPHLPAINYWHTGRLHWWCDGKWRRSMTWGRWLAGLFKFGNEHSIDTYLSALR